MTILRLHCLFANIPAFPAFLLITALGLIAGPQSARGAVLTHASFSIQSSGGSGGSGATTSDMIFDRYSSDGWGWAGGAGGVQGSQAITNTGGHAVPANETFKFDLGASVDLWNATYGEGNWTIANATLTFASSYSTQNNSRFGIGSGSFDIYWVANDAWAQSKGTEEDRGANPVYATSAENLETWAGDVALLGSEIFSVPDGGSGYVNLTYQLDPALLLVEDILSASASADRYLSLYLMATSDTIGMIIFTGGQSQPLPALSFYVVAVPEPSTGVMVAVFTIGFAGVGSRRKR